MLNLIPLFSSSKGNCTYICSAKTKLLVDAGVSCKRLTDTLINSNINPNEIQGILVTHEHSDHTKGIKLFAQKFNIPVYASKKTWTFLKILELPEDIIRSFSPESEFEIGDITVFPFSIPHDAIEPCGFNFSCENEKVTVATDLGHMTPNLLQNMCRSNSILLESNHDINMLRSGKYPYCLQQRILGDTGHLSNNASAETIEYLIKTGTKKIFLGHLSQENNLPELALETIRSRLLINKIDFSNVSIEVAKP